MADAGTHSGAEATETVLSDSNKPAEVAAAATVEHAAAQLPSALPQPAVSGSVADADSSALPSNAAPPPSSTLPLPVSSSVAMARSVSAPGSSDSGIEGQDQHPHSFFSPTSDASQAPHFTDAAAAAVAAASSDPADADIASMPLPPLPPSGHAHSLPLLPASHLAEPQTPTEFNTHSAAAELLGSAAGQYTHQQQLGAGERRNSRPNLRLQAHAPGKLSTTPALAVPAPSALLPPASPMTPMAFGGPPPNTPMNNAMQHPGGGQAVGSGQGDLGAPSPVFDEPFTPLPVPMSPMLPQAPPPSPFPTRSPSVDGAAGPAVPRVHQRAASSTSANLSASPIASPATSPHPVRFVMQLPTTMSGVDVLSPMPINGENAGSFSLGPAATQDADDDLPPELPPPPMTPSESENTLPTPDAAPAASSVAPAASAASADDEDVEAPAFVGDDVAETPAFVDAPAEAASAEDAAPIRVVMHEAPVAEEAEEAPAARAAPAQDSVPQQSAPQPAADAAPGPVAEPVVESVAQPEVVAPPAATDPEPVAAVEAAAPAVAPVDAAPAAPAEVAAPALASAEPAAAAVVAPTPVPAAAIAGVAAVGVVAAAAAVAASSSPTPDSPSALEAAAAVAAERAAEEDESSDSIPSPRDAKNCIEIQPVEPDGRKTVDPLLLHRSRLGRLSILQRDDAAHQGLLPVSPTSSGSTSSGPSAGAGAGAGPHHSHHASAPAGLGKSANTLPATKHVVTSVKRVQHVTFNPNNPNADFSAQLASIPDEWKEALKQQFGLPPNLQPAVKLSYTSRIPSVLVNMHSHLQTSNVFKTQVGIFRLAPDQAECARLKTALNSNVNAISQVKPGEYNDLSACCANLIKVWFRDLPAALFHALPVTRLALLTPATPPEELEALIVAYLKEPHQSIYRWLLDLCCEVTAHAETNKMIAKNMAICIGPNLYKPPAVDTSGAGAQSPAEAMKIIQQCKHYTTFLELCIHMREQQRGQKKSVA